MWRPSPEDTEVATSNTSSGQSAVYFLFADSYIILANQDLETASEQTAVYGSCFHTLLEGSVVLSARIGRALMLLSYFQMTRCHLCPLRKNMRWCLSAKESGWWYRVEAPWRISTWPSTLYGKLLSVPSNYFICNNNGNDLSIWKKKQCFETYWCWLHA